MNDFGQRIPANLTRTHTAEDSQESFDEDGGPKAKRLKFH